MTTEYNTLLKAPQWIAKRNTILARDKNKCRSCGTTTELQVHHRQYHIVRRTGQKKLPWEYNNKYLITLCNKCHSVGHSKFKIPSFTI